MIGWQRGEENSYVDRIYICVYVLYGMLKTVGLSSDYQISLIGFHKKLEINNWRIE